MHKIFDNVKVTNAIVPTVGAAASSSALYDTRDFRAIAAIAQFAAGTAGVVTATLYESTAATWNGAVATIITASRVTGAITTTVSALLQPEIDDTALAGTKRYIGVYIETPAATDTANAVLVQDRCRYNKV